jgi:hypothetical protein
MLWEFVYILFSKTSIGFVCLFFGTVGIELRVQIQGPAQLCTIWAMPPAF